MITSRHNPHIREALSLQKRRERDRKQECLIEGYRELERAIQSGWACKKIFFCSALAQHSVQAPPNTNLIPCSEEVFSTLSYREHPDGWLGVFQQKAWGMEEIPVHPHAVYLVVEHIEKPGNLGAMLRSADAVGVEAVFVVDPSTDIYNPNVVRASLGTLFSRPVIQMNSESVLHFLQERGIDIIAMTPEAPCRWTAVDMTSAFALVVGSEQQGLSTLWKEAATYNVGLPMLGTADSLNVAIAATVMLYEAIRQRTL